MAMRAKEVTPMRSLSTTILVMRSRIVSLFKWIAHLVMTMGCCHAKPATTICIPLLYTSDSANCSEIQVEAERSLRLMNNIMYAYIAPN